MTEEQGTPGWTVRGYAVEVKNLVPCRILSRTKTYATVIKADVYGSHPHQEPNNRVWDTKADALKACLRILAIQQGRLDAEVKEAEELLAKEEQPDG